METPRVTCVIPTANRREFIPQALRCFFSQDWPNKELLIVDDGEEKIADLIPADERIRYMKLDGPQRLTGEKRNICAELSGEIIAHCDDDDWYGPGRLTDQVTRLLQSGKSVSGYYSICYWNGSRAFTYSGGRQYSLGASMVYFREWWKKHPFPDKKVGEDSAFGGEAWHAGQLVNEDGKKFLVARAHPKNTSLKPLDSGNFPPIKTEELPAEFLETLCNSL